MGKKATFNVFVSSTYRNLKESQRVYTSLIAKKYRKSIEIALLIQRAFLR
jgi:hypothetical protein